MIKLRHLAYCTAAAFAFTGAANTVSLKPDDNWKVIRFNVNQIEKGSVLDLGSILNHHRPAGKYGFLKAKGEYFEFEKLPGVRQRFFGVNLSENSNIPTKAEAPLMAEAIARAGYNSVRFHHFENDMIDPNGKTSLDFDEEKLDRFFFLINELKKRGIYMTIDLYCSRSVKKDEIPGLWTPLGHWNYRNAVYVHQGAYDNFIAYCLKLVTRKNPYTGLAMAQDPAFCFVSLLNENWVDVWDDNNGGGLGWKWKDYYINWCKKNNVPKEKYTGDIPMRKKFLVEFQHNFWKRISADMRKHGWKVPLTMQNNGYSPILGYMRFDYDYTDQHFYIGHPFIINSWRPPVRCDHSSFMDVFDLAYRHRNPERYDKASLNTLQETYAIGPSKLFGTRSDGKPYTITELKWCRPNRQRGEGGAFAGAIAGLQDWDGLYSFQWAWGGNQFMGEGLGGYFCIYGDPTTYLSDHMIHLLFLRRDISASDMKATQMLPSDPKRIDPKVETISPLAPVIGMVMKTTLSVKKPANANYTWNYASKKSAENLLKKLEAGPIGKHGLIDRKNRHFRSTTGELELLADQGTFKVVSPKSEALVIQKEIAVKGKQLSVKNHTPYTTCFASALDDKNLADSKRILFMHITNCGAYKMTYSGKDLEVLESYGQLPHLVYRATADISLKLASAGSTPKVYAVNLRGQRVGEMKSVWKDGVLSFRADTAGINNTAIMVYEIVR